jgi:glycosyltransferase involved in cell wall biosynthesis
MSKVVAINQPRTSYFLGGAEMISIEHAKQMCILEYEVTFFTISPLSINKTYSRQYLNFKNEYASKITFIELGQSAEALYIYDVQPGENRDRWNIESLHYNRSLYQELSIGQRVYDLMLTYYKLDALLLPTGVVKNNALYLCGIPKVKNEFMSSFLAMYNSISAITDAVRDYWQEYTPKRISIVPTGVDAKRFKPILKKSDSIHIVFMGRLIKRKGCDVLLHALARLEPSLLDRIKVSIVGEGPQLDELRGLVQSLGLESIVIITGPTDHPESILASADLCVFPSREGEGLQGVLLEAMSSGAFVIASNSAVNRKLLSGGRGFVLEHISAPSLAAALTSFASKTSDAISSGRKAREYVIAHYNWTMATQKLLESIL